jgi:hypothetical protein
MTFSPVPEQSGHLSAEVLLLEETTQFFPMVLAQHSMPMANFNTSEGSRINGIRQGQAPHKAR